jgi:WD40 repeat protein
MTRGGSYSAAISTVAVNADEKGVVATGGHDNAVKLWDLRTTAPSLLACLLGHTRHAARTFSCTVP